MRLSRPVAASLHALLGALTLATLCPPSSARCAPATSTPQDDLPAGLDVYVDSVGRPTGSIYKGPSFGVFEDETFNTLKVGVQGHGMVGQIDYTLTLTQSLSLGIESGSTGTYNLSEMGTLLASAEGIGGAGTGTFTQSGGTNTVANILSLGSFAGSSGSYTLSAGTLTTGFTQIGYYSTGIFIQSGGTHTVDNTLSLGSFASSSGSYTLSAGTLTTGSTQIGDNGTGIFTQSGGVHNTYLVTLTNDTPGSQGTYNLNGGTLAAAGITSDGGTFGKSTFNFNGGTLQATQTSVALLQGLTTVNVRGSNATANSGANINTNGFDVTVAQALVHSTIADAAAIDGGLTKSGLGTLTLSGGNTYTGTTRVSAGTLALGGVGTLGANTAALVLAGGALDLGGSSQTVGALTITAAAARGDTLSNGSITAASYAANGFAGNAVISANLVADTRAALTLAFEGSLTLTGTNTYGNTTINSGILSIGNGGTTGTVGRGSISISGGSTLFFKRSNDLNVANNISGEGSLTNVGTGTLTLTGTNTYGSTTISAGTLQVGSGGTVGSLGMGTVTNSAALVFNRSDNVSVANAIGGTGSLTKLGAGTLTLSGTNTYAGGTLINAGTLQVGSDANLGASGGAVTVNPGGRLLFTGSATVARTLNLGTSTLAAPAGGTLSFNAATLNGGFLANNNTGVLGSGTTLNNVTTLISHTLTQASGAATLNTPTLRGTLTQTGGTLALNDAEVTGSARLSVGGTINTTNTEIQGVSTVVSGGTLANSTSSLYLTGGSRTTVNPGGTLATAAGTTIELNGSQLINNGTQIGTLNVNYGSTANGAGTFGAVNVTDGGRFGANATTGGAVSNNSLSVIHLSGPNGLANTAFVGPQLQATPGTANVVSLTLGSGSVFAFNVQDAQGAAGSGYDLAHASGTLTLAAGTTAGNLITVSVASLDGIGIAGHAANFDPTRNYAFVLVQADGGISGYQANEFVVDASAFQNPTQGGSFSVVQQGNNLDLVFTSDVPEPSTWTLLGLGDVVVLALALRQRRPRAA